MPPKMVRGAATEKRRKPGVEVGLRERKAATTRMAIADAIWHRLATSPLAEIPVDELAAEVGVSRMTFFNYFPTKEHAVDALMLAMVTRIMIDVRRAQLRGIAALERYFEIMGQYAREAPHRLRRITAHFANDTRHHGEWVALSPADVEQIAPGEPPLADEPHLGWQLHKHLEEARADGHLPHDVSSYELSHHLGVLIFGGAMIGSSNPDTDYLALYRRHLRRALGLIGSDIGVEPAEPRVPKAWRKKVAR